MPGRRRSAAVPVPTISCVMVANVAPTAPTADLAARHLTYCYISDVLLALAQMADYGCGRYLESLSSANFRTRRMMNSFRSVELEQISLGSNREDSQYLINERVCRH
jgi:hypothetical protein